ncbi:MAG: hypothetical protein HY336_00430 [Candidatus Doudnabacteria bacterium]|nr:hypothetical protein [Candidatus Doudnabacteria bacterium]
MLKLTLALGVAYYLIGAVVHWFGLTLFPFFDARLYTSYQDSVIAVAALVIAMFLFVIARDPVKNIDTLKIVILAAFLGSIFSIAIVWKVDFDSIGAPDKKLQTIVEGIMGFAFAGSLLYFYPRK